MLVNPFAKYFAAPVAGCLQYIIANGKGKKLNLAETQGSEFGEDISFVAVRVNAVAGGFYFLAQP